MQANVRSRWLNVFIFTLCSSAGSSQDPIFKRDAILSRMKAHIGTGKAFHAQRYKCLPLTPERLASNMQRCSEHVGRV
ncbi:uncharacterized protein MYCFIDRAFT_174837 [Pseudocercospora fijiensis CIRAD86]|uniref:Secreted protein n=1 Tax=Pseudocercospora fijiensis (strain CIRAD86) TaxID=383855 RepID=M3AFL8_PSEFD|nr:uncharacterized protein MYCFIDRAFT_174837 [Pseudocercospora fijiensis CIRAD86]EME83391.1 hypothetical protein MYCFIDRAFT_174837 [Pseudocercospora fijiensis CIRAD86]